MKLSDKLKTLRKDAGLSQERLAEKLNVSRQAVTKWESGAGLPDIDNIVAISRLFGISTDDLLSVDVKTSCTDVYRYKSITEYDIDESKHYDINLADASRVSVCGYDGEKVRVVLLSDTITDIERRLKVRIDDIRNRIDIVINKSEGLTRAQCRENLVIQVLIPTGYGGQLEIKADARDVKLSDITCDDVEVGGRINSVNIMDVTGHVEVDLDTDARIELSGFSGKLDINQHGGVSRLIIPADFSFELKKKGLATKVFFKENGNPVDRFDIKESENIIEFNGIRSELLVERI